MFRLLKLVFVLAGLAGFVWFGANVPLGSQTLFQHLQAIGRTRETKDLLDGTRDRARPLVDGVRRRIAGGLDEAGDPRSSVPAADAGAPPAERLTDKDRERL